MRSSKPCRTRPRCASRLRVWARAGERRRWTPHPCAAWMRGGWPDVGILAVVVVAWAALALDKSHAVARLVPLEIRGVGEGIAFNLPRFTSIAVGLRSSRRELELLSDDAVAAYVDLSGGAPGARVFRVQTTAPAGIEIVSTTPSFVSLTLRPRVAPTVGVAPAAFSRHPESGDALVCQRTVDAGARPRVRDRWYPVTLTSSARAAFRGARCLVSPPPIEYAPLLRTRRCRCRARSAAATVTRGTSCDARRT